MSKTVKDTIRPSGYSSTTPKREVAFVLNGREAEEVYLCGDFNQWVPHSLPMIRHGEYRLWEKRLLLPPGRYEYKFIVDGEWVHGDRVRNNVLNAHGSLHSVVEVKL